MNGGELSPKSVVMDHFLDDTAQFPRRSNISILKDSSDCKFTLVALCRATRAKLQDFDQDIHIELEALQSSVIKEEQALERMMSKH